ncbi:HAD family hydrolase [Pseudooceanicola algae]|uniref:phosphoglycolate phosphatase n=1 Tax=Pseudooceanicola algae TaxID=1537215 RepID=A0A418SCH5_9RHOB|nr:HAD family hydrolase [Pseudooceanicola algae]QPM90088.1 Phosphoglycolate phosphatase [Pseudooceanicola algae]
MAVTAILFDKDGTLFEFGASWNAWAQVVIAELSGGEAHLADTLAGALRFDLASGSFHADSPVIAGSNREVAELIGTVLPGAPLEEIETYLSRSAAEVPLVPVVPLEPLLEDLAGQGIALGVMTNDSEASAVAQLTRAGILELFSFVAGSDSGHGAKPDPAPLRAFLTGGGHAAGDALMVGDSTHDLLAGRAAGMTTVAVLTGLAGSQELSPIADVILPHIGHLPAWLARTDRATPTG